MNTLQLSTENYYNTEIETLLKKEEKYFVAEMTVLATHEAEQSDVLTPAHFQSICMELASRRMQIRKHEIDQQILLGSKILHVLDFEDDSQRKFNSLASLRQDAENRTVILTLRNEELSPYLEKIKLYKGLRLAKWFVMFGEFVLIYGAARHSNPFLQSIVIASAGAFLIGALLKPVSNWIRNAKTEKSQQSRFFSVIGISAVGFSILAFARAKAMNAVIDVNLEQHDHIYTSPLFIAIVSIGLFCGLLFLSVCLWRSRKQQREDEEYMNNEKEINVCKIKVRDIQEQENNLRDEIIAMRNLARMIRDYYESAIKRLRAIGNMGVSVFKATYSTKKHSTPEFFNSENPIKFDTSIPFSKPQTSPNA